MQTKKLNNPNQNNRKLFTEFVYSYNEFFSSNKTHSKNERD